MDACKLLYLLLVLLAAPCAFVHGASREALSGATRCPALAVPFGRSCADTPVALALLCL